MTSKIDITGVAECSPEVRFTESNLAVATFSIVFEEEKMKRLRCTLYGKKAQECKDVIRAGTKLVACGTLIRQGESKKPCVQVQGYEVISSVALSPAEEITEDALFDDI